MTPNEYQKLAMTTLNKQLSKDQVLLNGVMGLCGESGEAIDILKKHLMQGHELDREHLITELGDIAWYLAETATALDISLEEVLERNIAKLRRRYPEGFDTEKSLHRPQESDGIDEMLELEAIMKKFADSGWEQISVPAQQWLSRSYERDTVIAAIRQADAECGSYGCELDPLYKRALELF